VGETTVEWIDLRVAALIAATSTDPSHPIQNAFDGNSSTQWRAAEPGRQVVEVHFDRPRDLRRIRLMFVEDRTARTQQFTIRCSSNRGERHREVVRQQFTFSPAGATGEVEEYRISVQQVCRLAIEIIPDIGNSDAVATLTEVQVA
jgi:hypothetical protein